MYYAYVLKSTRCEYFYKGHCSNIEKRLAEHNSGMTKSLRPYLPVILVYFESFDTKTEAIDREKYYKIAAGRKFIKRKIAP